MITWRKLKHPTAWRPSVPGDELIGYYIGQSPRKGAFGEYTVALIATPTGDGTVGVPRIVSGTALLNEHRKGSASAAPSSTGCAVVHPSPGGRRAGRCGARPGESCPEGL